MSNSLVTKCDLKYKITVPFCLQLPPTLSPNPNRRIVEQYKRALFSTESNGMNLKSEMRKVRIIFSIQSAYVSCVSFSQPVSVYAICTTYFHVFPFLTTLLQSETFSSVRSSSALSLHLLVCPLDVISWAYTKIGICFGFITLSKLNYINLLYVMILIIDS